jgi:hypothetical protein
MTTFESAARRILSPLSELLQKPLPLVDGQSLEAGQAFAVRMGLPRVAVVCADGRPFAEEERRLIHVDGALTARGEPGHGTTGSGGVH